MVFAKSWQITMALLYSAPSQRKEKALLIRLLIILLVVILAVPVAQAQDNVIRVINEDGSVTEFEIPGWGAEAPRVPKAQPKVQPKKQAPQKRSPRKVEPKKTVPLLKDEPMAPTIDDAVGKTIEPSEMEVTPETLSESFPFPLPSRKPRVPAGFGKKNVRDLPPAPTELMPGTVINEKRAIDIAIDHAPPSRKFKTFRIVVDGRPVYQVVFKLDSGGVHEVLVDAFTGDLVKR